MHMATIGLFGKHICNSIVYKISNTLRNDVLIKGLTEDGSPLYIISEAVLENVYDSLCERLQHFHWSHAGFQLTSKYTAHFKRVFLDMRSNLVKISSQKKIETFKISLS